MKITCAHGTAKQFEEAVKNRIEELGGNAETITSATIYKDVDGVMGEAGDTWTVQELREYWDTECLNDPVLVEYDSFDSWLADTISFMAPIEASADVKISATEAIDNGEYITALYHEIKDNIADGISVNLEASDEDKIIFVASDGNRIVSFEVPYSDIEFDWDAFDINADLIQKTIEDEFDSLEASTDIEFD